MQINLPWVSGLRTNILLFEVRAAMNLSGISKALNDSNDRHTTEGIVLSPSAAQSEDTPCTSWNPVASSSALQSFLDHIPVDSIINFLNSPALELKHDDCVQDAIRALYDRNVLGAPIINFVSSDQGNFIDRDIGFIEFSSMVLWSLEEFNNESVEPKSDSHRFLSTLNQISQIGQTKIGELAKLYLWEPFFPIECSGSLLQIMLLFSKHSRLKVVPVVESSNSRVVGFITQSAVLQLLLRSSGLDWFDQIADKPISDFGFERSCSLVYMFGDQTVANALHILWENHFDAVPVVERVSKTLIGTVRSSDLYLLLEDDELYHNRKSINLENFITLYSKRRTRPESNSPSHGERGSEPAASLLLKKSCYGELPPMDAPTTVLSSQTLKQAMQAVSESTNECCFLVSESGHLQLTITLRDILSKFSPPSMDAAIDGGGFFRSALEQAGCFADSHV